MLHHHVVTRSLLLALLLALAAIPAARPALAIDSSWNADADGNWSDAAKWTAGVPNAINDIARLTYKIHAPRTVTIDGSARTVGSLYLAGIYINGYTVAGAGLDLEVVRGEAIIQSSGTGVTHGITAPVSLYDSASIAVDSGELQISGTISSGVAGTGLTKIGAGTLVLSGPNTYSGRTTVSMGVLRANDGVGLPANSNLYLLSGGILELTGGATFLRNAGSGPGQVHVSGGGFAARGGKATVGTTCDVRAFGSPTADSEVDFVNPIDLKGATCAINVIDNPNTGNDFATLSGVISNGGICKRDEGTLALKGLNTYTGVTHVEAGAVRAADGIGLPAASNLYLYQGVLESDGPATFTRSLGTGSGQVQWKIGGFSAHGGKLTVNLGGAAVPLVLGNGGLPTCFLFGSPTADSETEFVHAIDLNGKTAGIFVSDNPSSAGDFATLSGVLSNGAIEKQRFGTLALTGHNTYTGITTIGDGALRATDGIGLPAGSNLHFYGHWTASTGVLESEGPATFTRSLGSGAGQVQWTGAGGFSAHGGKMTVAIGGTASPTALTWGSAGFVQSGGLLFFGSWTADNETVFTNSLNLNGAERTIKVRDNPATDGDFATMSGVISNGSLMKEGTGTLALTATNTYTGSTTIKDGALYAIDGVGLPTASRLVIGFPTSTGSPVFESNGLFTRPMGNKSGQVSVLNESSGFAARGGKLTVALGGLASPTPISWSSGPPGLLHIVLLLSSCTADSEVELANRISIAYTEAPIFVNDNPFTDSDFATLSGVVSSNYAGPMKDGPGTLYLAGANTYSPATTVVAGALRATDGVGLPAASNLVLSGGVFEGRGTAAFVRSLGATGPNRVQWTGSGGFSAFGGKMTVAIGGAASLTALTWGTGNFVPSGSALVFGSLTADNETEFKNSINLAGGSQTVLVMDNPFSTGDFGTLSGALSNGSLTKDGPGMLVLKGSQTYTGATTVAAGTLKLASGAALASTTFDVNAGATLDLRNLLGGLTLGAGKTLKGGGTILGDLVIGGTLSPGESPGILSVDDITFAAGSILNMELGGTVRGGYDALVSSGDVVLQDGSTLSVTLIGGFAPELGHEFDILDFSSLSGRFTTINLPALPGGLSWSTDDLYLNGTIGVTPEPATLALLALGSLALLSRRRK